MGDSRAGVIKLIARAGRIVLPQHVARGDLHANAILRQLKRLRFRDDLLQQHRGFAFQLCFFFLLLLRVGRCLRSCRSLAARLLCETEYGARQDQSGGDQTQDNVFGWH